jgi:hypothetical protein
MNICPKKRAWSKYLIDQMPSKKAVNLFCEDAYFSPQIVLTKMTRPKASSIFIFIFVAIDFLFHKESRNTENCTRVRTIMVIDEGAVSLPKCQIRPWSVIG